MQELEREKDTLQLQVTVLEDQIESQSRRIKEIGKRFFIWGSHVLDIVQ
jgi:chaperonin cofactor prefoldin